MKCYIAFFIIITTLISGSVRANVCDTGQPASVFLDNFSSTKTGWSTINFDRAVSVWPNDSITTSSGQEQNVVWLVNNGSMSINGSVSNQLDTEYGMVSYDFTQDNISVTATNNYVLSADFTADKSDTNNDLGIIFGFVNDQNYYIAKWTKYGNRYRNNNQGYPGVHRRLELIKLVNGVATSLASKNNYDVNDPFNMEVVVDGQGINVCVNDTIELTSTEQPNLNKSGIFSYDNDNGISLDNFELRCNNCTAQPLANYRFDECSYTGATNEVIDQIGSYHGQSFGNLDTFAGGKIERAANFNAGGHRIEVSVPLPSSFSVTAWFKKPTATNGNRYFILGSMAAGGDLLFLDRNNNWRWGVYNPSLGNQYGTFRFNSLDSNWHHITLVYSGALTKLYIDGVFTDSVGRVPSGTLKYIGTSYDQVNSANPQGFRAPLDEFIVYNSALTASEITTIYNNQAAGKNWDNTTRAAVTCGDLIGLYKFEQTSFASNITDTSGFNNNGTNLGGSSIAAGKYCRGFDSNGSNSSTSTSNAFSTGLDLDSDVGVKGTISFWYKSNTDWNAGGYNSGGERTLFDASKDIGLGGGNKYFQLGVESDGRLRFTFEDSNDGDFALYEPSIAARSSNTWYYLTVTWDYSNDSFQLFVDGSLVVSGSPNTTGAIKDFGALIFGDNSSTYVANNNFSLSSPYSANGQFDEVRIYKKVLTQTEIQTDMNDNGGCFNIHHYQIEHDGTGLTCMPETVTIKACTDASCSNLSTNSASVDFNVAGITQTSPTFTGSTTTNFNHLVAETVTLSLSNTSPSPSNATVCKNGASNSCDMIFSEAGFILDVNNGANVESCTTPNLTIKAVKLSDNGVSCAPAFTGNQNLSVIFNYINPNSGTKLPQLNSGNGLTNLANAGVSQTRTINFDNNGEASLPLTYADAGQLSFNVAEVTSSGVSSGNVTKTFYPNKLVVSSALNSTNSSGTDKQKAGVDFPINITAQCANGTTTPNYAPQSTSVLQLSVQQKAPTAFTGSLTINGGNTISATNLLATTNWTPTNQASLTFNANYSEVGIINLAARDTNYFGSSINAGGTANYTNVGRFTPDHFIASVSNGIFANQCVSGDFTYIGQPFSYDAFTLPTVTITAQNKANVTTKNYTQTGYEKLTNSNINRTFSTTDSIKNGADATLMKVSVNSSNNGSLANDNGNGNNGQLIYTFSPSDNFTYTKDSNAKVAPFDVAALGVTPAISQYKISIDSIADSDGIDASAFLTATPQNVIPSGLKLRFGRLLIYNAYGPETSDLPLPLTTQYWDGSQYITNTLDSCTTYNTDLAANYTLSNTGLNPALATNVNTSSGNGTVANGLAEISLSKPTNGAQGQIRYTYDATPTWLLDDWDGDGNFDNKPSAVASFGIFRGNDRIIYWREVHQ